MELPADLVERAAAELNETPETRAAGLQALHQHYAAHPDEKPFRDDDPYLLMYLRHAKFDAAKARGRISATERWLRDCRSELGDVSQLRGDMFTEMYGQEFMGLLGTARRTRDGSLISLLRPAHMQPLADPTILLKWNLWVLTRAVHDPYIQVCGQVILESFVGFSLLHAVRFQQVPGGIMRKSFKFAQECMPFRMRGIWLVRPPKWVGVLFAMAKPFLSSKLRARVRIFAGDLRELHAQVDPALLPAEFGGSHPDSGGAWFARELLVEAAERGEAPQRLPEGGAEPAAAAAAAAAVEL